MNYLKTIKPTTITLFTTFQCTANCKNCCFGCKQTPTKSMSILEMKHYIDICMAEYGSTLKVLVLSGGECMLFPNRVNKIIKYATSLGLSVRIVTNGFWAATYRIAYKTINILMASGLKEINFSTGDDHQKWIPFNRIRNAAVAAARLGLNPIINIETPDNDSHRTLRQISKDKIFFKLILDGKIKIERGIWMDFSKEKSNVPHNNSVTKRFDRCLNLFNIIPINPYGEVLACCGLTSEQNPFLRIGNINKATIKSIYEFSFNDVMKIWLYVEGPAKIIQYICQRKKNTLYSS